MSSSTHAHVATASGRSGRTAGFTLIELVIVVAIVAILAAIALPSYRQHVLKANRTQGRADLMQVAQSLERTYTVSRDYRTSTLCGRSDIPSPPTGDLKYTIQAVCAARNTFVLTAVPTGTQSGDTCGNSTLNNAGQKTTAGDPNLCHW